jgi:oxalate decarboxylase/phosphoglucose isomerase-like protein (cupin superfamily)
MEHPKGGTMADHTIEQKWQGENGLTFDLVTLRPGGVIEPHYHRHKREMYLWQSGAGLVSLEHVDKPFRAGDMDQTTITIPISAIHSVRNTGPEPLVFFAIYYATPETVNDYYPA